MTHTQAIAAPPSADGKPKALKFVRNDVSGPHALRHAGDVQRHARRLGYRYVYTVRPPADTDDPIGYLLGMAAEFGVEVIVVFDLGHVDSQPSSVCDKGFDLETVCPQGTWTRSAQPGPDVDAGAA